ncbi:Retrovirus-related Pol polyprotein from transposon 412 [Frankliniella fusca]|uniref:RNA-directed DNA polymerase n=1 Tax=Frankliniella fusca TaxID=407009 RepID=A0AAE1HYN9_9NEOP|nr:Retrovirus-related Pol polyprotein from transposon 412 [Frankliniella fusca]KAK3929636.1 Retrovirus-related Pol polyprotein from transposon 412 [Frankliniella fusca]
MKGATSHTGILYGPVMTKITIQGKDYNYPVYEANIEENLLGFDFMEKFDATIKVKRQEIYFGDNKVPFQLGKSKERGNFDSGKLFYTVRAGKDLILRPFVEKEVSTFLETDFQADELERCSSEFLAESQTRTDSGTSSAQVLSTSGLLQGKGQEGCTLSAETKAFSEIKRSSTERDHFKVFGSPTKGDRFESFQSPKEGDISESLKTGSFRSDDFSFGSQPIHQMEFNVRLGLFLNSKGTGPIENKLTKLPATVSTKAGVVPCISGPMTVSLTNWGDKCLKVPKYAILGEVYLLHPMGDDHNSNEDEKYEEEEGMVEVNSVSVSENIPRPVEHIIKPFNGVEVETTPSKDPIPEDTPLPEDLQKMVDSDKFTILHTYGSILESPEDLPIVHAVSHDGKFGKGLARQLEQEFQLREDFLKEKDRGFPGYVALQRGNRIIVNLITKSRYFHKPTSTDVEQAFLLLRDWLEANHISEWCLPELGCGLDQLESSLLLQMLVKVFGHTDMTLVMYHYDPPQECLYDIAAEKTCNMECGHCEPIKDTEDITVNWTRIVPDGVSTEDMIREQRLDQDIMPILVAVEEGKRPHLNEIVGLSSRSRSLWHQFNSLCMDNQLLHRRFEHPSGLPEKEILQLILPRKYVDSTIQHYHSQLGEVNHFGVAKTLGHLNRFFWWPGMSTDVAAKISKCEKCLKYKGPIKKGKAPLKIFHDGVLHGRWHVDVCDMPTTTDGYKYLLVAVEALSGWPVMVPMKKQNSETIAKALIEHVFSVYGAPISILTDQGRAFESELFREIMDLYHIKKLRTSSYHPSANGKAERWIRTLKKSIAMLVGKAQHNWPDYVPFVAQAYRSLPHSAHKFSPYEVLFGAPMRTPSTLTQGIPPQAKLLESYPYEVREALGQIHDAVRTMNSQAATKMKEYYDKTAMIQPFVVGDKALLYRKVRKSGESLKLKALWEGPFKIIGILNDCNARIERIDPPKERLIVHMDRLAPYPKTDDSPGAWLNFLDLA